MPDPGVLISGWLSSKGVPAELFRYFVDGKLDFVVTPRLLRELESVLRREKFRRYLSEVEVYDLISWFSNSAVMVADPVPQGRHTPDPKDDYLIELARSASAPILSSGDRHLLAFDRPPPRVLSPRSLVTLLRAWPG